MSETILKAKKPKKVRKNEKWHDVEIVEDCLLVYDDYKYRGVGLKFPDGKIRRLNRCEIKIEDEFFKEMLKTIEQFGKDIGSHGWEIPARYVALKRIKKLLNKHKNHDQTR